MSQFMFESEHAASVLSELRQMVAGRSSKVQTLSALLKLETKLGLPRILMNEAVRDLYRAGLLQYKADGNELPVSGFISIVAEPIKPLPHQVDWISALEEAGFDQSEAIALEGLADNLFDLAPDDMVHLARNLKLLKEADVGLLNDVGFNVSAKRIMGSSKVVSMMSKRMLSALNLPLRLHNPSPKYVLCAGPRSPTATLLIENPRAFENAICSGLADEVALICTFGFGLAYLRKEWVQAPQAPHEPHHDRPIMVVRDGEPPPLLLLLSASNVFLWADLDLAGINIYRSLKNAIPQLQFSRIYEAMIPMLEDPSTSHPYAKIFDKSGQNCGVQNNEACISLDFDSLSLWKVCQSRAVDQEAVDEPTIKELGGAPYLGKLAAEFGNR